MRKLESFFEDVYKLSLYPDDYEKLFKSVYQQHLTECTANRLYNFLRQFKDDLSEPKNRNKAINEIVQSILTDDKEVFEISSKNSDSNKPKPCVFLDELDQIYWHDQNSIFDTVFLESVLYELFLNLKKQGVGIGEKTLKNAVVGKIKKNFWDANRGDYERALKDFIHDFLANNSRADFSNVDKDTRNKYAKKFKALVKSN